MVAIVVEATDPDVPTAPNRKLMSVFCARWAKAAVPRKPLMKQNVQIVFIEFSLGSMLRAAAPRSHGIRMSGAKSPMDGAGRENAAHRLNAPLIGHSLS
jgi:hypothetical protein